MAKIKFARNWFEEAEQPKAQVENLLEQSKIIRKEDLPEWLSAAEAAPFLRVKPDTAWLMLKKQTVRSTKVSGRRVTTAQWIAEYLRQQELKSHG